MTIKPSWPFIHYWLVFSHIVVNDPFVAEKGTDFICVSGLLISFLSQDLPCRSPHHLPVSCHHKFPQRDNWGRVTFIFTLSFFARLFGRLCGETGRSRENAERRVNLYPWLAFAFLELGLDSLSLFFDEEQQFSVRHVDRERVGIFLTTFKPHKNTDSDSEQNVSWCRCLLSDNVR